MTHRFFVDGPIGEETVLEGERARQIATVLRLKAGDVVTLIWNGAESTVVLESVTPRRVTGRLRDQRPAADTEPVVRLTLAMPLLRGERSEEVVEAVTQLGVARIVPFVSSRSVVRTLSAAKLGRWRKIARESAETARRVWVPEIESPVDWRSLFERLDPPILLAWEAETGRPLAKSLPKGNSLSLLIGPEGGLAPDEVALAWARGAKTVTLGRRNLRSETAAIAAVAIVVGLLDSATAPGFPKPLPRRGVAAGRRPRRFVNPSS